jgi:cation transport ATPase
MGICAFLGTPETSGAAVCGVFGLAGFIGERAWGEDAWVVRVLYLVALLAGGWDAAKDTAEHTSAFYRAMTLLVVASPCALEANSQHPIARAITHYGRTHGVKERPVEEFESLSGQGLRGRHEGATMVVCLNGLRLLLGRNA